MPNEGIPGSELARARAQFRRRRQQFFRYPGLLIHSKRWDATWIANRAMKISEEYGIPTLVIVEGSDSVKTEVLLAVTSEVGKGVLAAAGAALFTYVLTVVRRASRRNRKVEVRPNDEWRKEELPYQ